MDRIFFLPFFLVYMIVFDCGGIRLGNIDLSLSVSYRHFSIHPYSQHPGMSYGMPSTLLFVGEDPRINGVWTVA
jgi:hypothetical protein